MYEKITLDNGVRILFEHLDNIRSASLGIWVKTGSRNESAATNGYAHFIEHMLFKGTENRTARDLACEMDEIGGGVNAFTTKECTCFYARVLDTHIPRATDLLCDMFFSSRFAQEDVETERGVILEEIGMYEDSPDDLVTERLFSQIYKGSALGRPILGSPAVLKKATGESLRAFKQEQYRPENTVVAIAGSFAKSDIDELARRFSAMDGRLKRRQSPVRFSPALTVKRKTTEQNHICLAYPCVAWGHPDRYVLSVMSSVLGSGMSSRLFQSLREERGLCYSVYSFISGHEDAGLLGIYAALSRDAEPEAIELILAQLRALLEGGVTEDELVRAREQAKANVLMSLESTVSRMNRLARGELLLGFIQEPEEIIAEYDAVDADRVLSMARSVFDPAQRSFSAVGKVRSAEEYAGLLGAQ